MNRARTILVVGAYGLVGREVVRLLVDKTDAAVIASGRKPERLASVTAGMDTRRVTTRVLDAHDAQALPAACAEASSVINCVGPYLESGATVASAALEAGASYVDFASEQAHYERLKESDAVARDKGLFLLTGAGVVPGFSAVLAMRGAAHLPAADSLEIIYAQGRMAVADGGLGSLMTGVLEAGFAPVMLCDGTRVPVRLGDERKRVALPAPFGEVDLIGFPTLEVFTLSKRLPVRSIANYWLLGDTPPILFTLIYALKPHRRPWAYRLLRHLTERSMERDYARAVAKGVTVEALLRVTLQGAGKRWQATLRFPEGGGMATAYLPVLAAKRWLERRFEHVGLVTPIDAFPPEALFRDMAELGWYLDLKEHAQDGN